MHPSQRKWIADPGRILPGNTKAKAFTTRSSWETVIASGIVLALQKKKILRKGRREGGRREVGSFVGIQRWVREIRVSGDMRT
jgi:hypothetical protein